MHGYQSQGARPKRSVRHPAYLEDFEVQYPSQPGASLTEQQPHGREEYRHSRRRMAHQQDFSHYSSDEGSGRKTPDSLEARSQQTEPWYLIKDQWSERDEHSSHSLPRESRERLCDLERENRQLRQTQVSMREEIRQLIEIQKGMQEMLMRNQSSPVHPLHEQQPVAPSHPIPSPRTIYREPENPVPQPAPRVQPVPAPRKFPTPPNRKHIATDLEAHRSALSVQSYYPDTFADQVPTSTPLRPAVSSRYQPHRSPANTRERQTSVTRQEMTYRGPQPTIPDFIHRDPSEFTRLKTLEELSVPNKWSQGPSFLLRPEPEWPVTPPVQIPVDKDEQRKGIFCGIVIEVTAPTIPEPDDYPSWSELIEATVQLHKCGEQPSAADYQAAEMLLLQKSQIDSFPEEYKLLKAKRPIPSNSRLLTLSPEYDESSQIIRVGGRLRRAEGLETSAIHPIVLDPHHTVTKLLIKDYDSKLCHPGPERIFAEIRRNFWVLRGREAIRRQQHLCRECKKWKAKPVIPKMADLPPARLRLQKPPFYSTGMDCFGPFQIKIGRRCEKRWGIIFKCLTTRCVHLDLLTSIDTDSFLMALRRFVARRGRPWELFSDQGTNFHGGEKELQEAFASLSPQLQQHLAKQKISFHFNPPNAPHFGGAWEREIRSVKTALRITIGSQTVTEEVLSTVLIEVEGILNSKPLGYTSSNVADFDPVTPNYLLMGRPDSALPPVVYPATELMGRRRWRQSQVLTDQFWSSFIHHYLPTLQARHKWHTDVSDISPGTIAMLVDPQLPRAMWLVGKVTKTFPGSDGHIRAVDIQVKNKTYTRPVARLIPLPSLEQDSETPN
ncbi:hypothetical protein QQF64_031038 [Cirrhinus molitorella]|uniref:Integrase catalytic domain-containing protein n=2 Tax=Cirrhinus molitorella TaxID=172907 RepID=A0ABR3N5E7_9TELE